MEFSEAEKVAMRRLKWVGDTVIARLEQLGYTSLAELKNAEASNLTKQISEFLGSTCWHNSPPSQSRHCGHH